MSYYRRNLRVYHCIYYIYTNISKNNNLVKNFDWSKHLYVMFVSIY